MAADLTERPTACPACGAAVRTDVSWCGLCYASLLPEPEPEPEPETQPAAAEDVIEDAGTEVGVGSDPDELDAVAARILAELAATRDPQPAWMDRLPTSRAGRAGLIAGAVALGSLLLVAAMSLLGLLL